MLSAILGISTSSCSNDNDNDVWGNTDPAIIGKWQLVSTHSLEHVNGVVIKETTSYEIDDMLEFKTDNSVIEYDLEKGTWKQDEKGKYSVNQNTLLMKLGSDTDTYTIKQLNASTLILEKYERENEKDGVHEEWDTTTWQKII